MSYLQALKKASSLREVAAILEVPPKSLSYILYKVPDDKKYTEFEIIKKSGRTRSIKAPAEPLKVVQRRLSDVLYACREEIESYSGTHRPLSHGFRKNLSIFSNSLPHTKKRYVLNVDLSDFFPSINFARVRGFFIKDNRFLLNEKTATIIAQIACFQNALPQGSPCSPVISDLITNILDLRLARLAKHYSCTYSRYADDITFSTNKKEFPPELACHNADDGEWIVGTSLARALIDAGFTPNPQKTRVQFRSVRQGVTGLTVNRKPNIPAYKYRWARAMCHSLFHSGAYYRPIGPAERAANGTDNLAPAIIKTFGPLHGLLSHIHSIKEKSDTRDEISRRKYPSSARLLYQKFLFFRYFVYTQQPIIVCEGKTDNVYIRYAIRSLAEFHPKLGAISDGRFQSRVRFFSYTNKSHQIVGLGGGTGDIKNFIASYESQIHKYTIRPQHPVIIIVDNDKGAEPVFSVAANKSKRPISIKSTYIYYRITKNLFLIKTPQLHPDGQSCIEDLFQKSVRDSELGGKKFNPDEPNPMKEYGKALFAEHVVQPNAHKIDFSGFRPLLLAIESIIDEWEAESSSAVQVKLIADA